MPIPNTELNSGTAFFSPKKSIFHTYSTPPPPYLQDRESPPPPWHRALRCKRSNRNLQNHIHRYPYVTGTEVIKVQLRFRSTHVEVPNSSLRRRRPSSIPGRDMFVSGALIENGDDLGTVQCTMPVFQHYQSFTLTCRLLERGISSLWQVWERQAAAQGHSPRRTARFL